MKGIIVTGSPGAGKTTLLTAADLKGCKLVNVGNLMKDFAVKLGYVNDRDKIRKLGQEKIDRLREEAFAAIGRMEGKLVIDTHATVESEGKFLTGLPFSIIGGAKWLKAIVYIDAQSDEILRRRALDINRHRENDGKEMLDVQRDINIATLSFYSSYLNISLYVIRNREGMLIESSSAFNKVLREIFGD